MEFVAREISEGTFVDVMAQYRPYYKARSEEFYGEIDRGITAEEYRAVVEHAREVGLERLYLDESMLSSRSGLLDPF
jgi:putative pyruvate formate lyase activating enzyme